MTDFREDAVQRKETNIFQFMFQFQTEHPKPQDALVKCVYDPRKFNNYLFWKLVYSQALENSVLDALVDLDYLNNEECRDSRVLLGSSANGLIDYLACWPVKEELIKALQSSPSNLQLKQILLECCICPDLKSFVYFNFTVNLAVQTTTPSGPTKLPPSGSTILPQNNSPSNNLFGISRNSRDPLLFLEDNIFFKQSPASIVLQVLGGFLAVVGAVAFVLALTLMTKPVAVTALAVTGVASLAAGLGLFYKGYNENLDPSFVTAFSQRAI
ncbi:MAG: hypothetical protein EBY16_01755 [Gammaproteobacteria bacterium]|nr:hypothetical protein [Gammaproteobacteria bacterium]